MPLAIYIVRANTQHNNYVILGAHKYIPAELNSSTAFVMKRHCNSRHAIRHKRISNLCHPHDMRVANYRYLIISILNSVQKGEQKPAHSRDHNTQMC